MQLDRTGFKNVSIKQQQQARLGNVSGCCLRRRSLAMAWLSISQLRPLSHSLSLSHVHTHIQAQLGTCAVQPALQTGFEGGNWPAPSSLWLLVHTNFCLLSARQAERAPVFFCVLVDLYLPLVRTVGWSERYLKRNQRPPVFVFVKFLLTFIKTSDKITNKM